MHNLDMQLRQLLIELGGLPLEFSRDSNLYLELGVPSVKAMELLMELEERFRATFPTISLWRPPVSPDSPP